MVVYETSPTYLHPFSLLFRVKTNEVVPVQENPLLQQK